MKANKIVLEKKQKKLLNVRWLKCKYFVNRKIGIQLNIGQDSVQFL